MAVITLEMLVVGGVFLVLLTTIVLRARASVKRIQNERQGRSNGG